MSAEPLLRNMTTVLAIHRGINLICKLICKNINVTHNVNYVYLPSLLCSDSMEDLVF